MGQLGERNAQIMLQMLLRMVHAAIQRNRERLRAEGARIAFKFDEAYYIMNETFALAAATGRDAGTEIVAAWQHSEQIDNRKVRASTVNLLQHRCVFRVTTQDAREMA